MADDKKNIGPEVETPAEAPVPGADQHQGRIAIWKGPRHTGPAADLPVQPFNHIRWLIVKSS